MRFKVFLYELQRRHVIKAAVAYLVVAWLIVQVLSIMTDAFNFPRQTLSISIIVMMICFPIWLLINWFYDITEEGIIKVQKEDVETESISVKSGNLNKIIITTLSVIVVLLIFNTIRLSAERKATENGKASIVPALKSSVAVLAFDDMSPLHDMEYFADGMSEEIINKLTKYKELTVINRTSSFYFKNKDVTLDSIGKELNVAFILEGSIRTSGDILRVTAQLIHVSDGSHVWSENYDRTLEDILQVQDEIAAAVAEKLEVTLLNEEILEHKIDPEAFQLYTMASDEIRNYQKPNTLKADSLIRKSLALDDTFSRSWSLMAQSLYFQTFHYFLLPAYEGIEQGKAAAYKALEIDETNAMGYVWLSKFSWQDKQASQATTYMDKAMDLAPNDPEVLYHAGNLALSTNRLRDAEKHYGKAMVLNPKGAEVIKRLSFVKWTKGDLKAAEKYIRLAYQYGLQDYLKNYELALLARDQGYLKRATELMEQEKEPYLKILLECSIHYASGEENEAKQILEQIKAMAYSDVDSETIDSNPEHDYEIACLYAFMNEADSAFVYLDRAYENVLNWPGNFFTMPDFNNIKEDPRWEAYLRRMGQDMQYDFLTNQ